MSPKSLLRHPECVSDLSDFDTEHGFSEYYADVEIKKARKVLLCSGKIYYDLLQYRTTEKIKDVAIVRIEQLYPMPEKVIAELQSKYKGVPAVWVQEEPHNMGAWAFIKSLEVLDGLEVICRKASASPATGFKAVHDQQQQDIVEQAFA